ncbi:MAG: hypothetical protein DHS20C18_20650 [Saprospiraceae bacterium]|nr:MAG: hypothetical protein DHS20C18_20650 [Saprospiraceae bacterium]
MSARNPIDAIFKDKLAHHSTEPPMHLWEKIDQKRSKRDRNVLYFRSTLVGLALLTTAAISLFLIRQNQETTIQFLPIPQYGQVAQAEIEQPQTTSLATKLEITKQHTESTKQKNRFPAPLNKATVKKEKQTLGQEINIEEAITIETEAGADEAIQSNNSFVLQNQWKSPKLEMPALDALQTSSVSAFKFTDPTDCAKFNKRPWRFFATFGGAIDLARRQLTPKDPDAAAYVATREGTELPFYTFTFDARVSVTSPIGLALTTGLDYTQINEKFDFLDPHAERTEIITNEYGPNGEILGTDTVLIFGQREKITYNRYRILDIPLLVGYELDFSHFSLEMKGGILLNIISRQKGDFLSPDDLQPISFTNDEPDAYPAFKQNIGLGYYGGISFNYKMNAGYQISFEPFFRVYPKSFTKEAFPVSQKYFLTGLQLGLKVPLR